MVKRKCRMCGVSLPKSRYFNCKACIPEMEADDDFIYHGGTIEDEPISEMEYLCSIPEEHLNEITRKEIERESNQD